MTDDDLEVWLAAKHADPATPPGRADCFSKFAGYRPKLAAINIPVPIFSEEWARKHQEKTT